MDLRVEFGNKFADAQEWLFRGRRRLATLAVCVLLLPLAHHVVYGANGWLAYKQKKVEYRQLQQELRQLQKENDDLERRVMALQQADPRVIEREAREQLGFAKPGEVVLVLPEERPRPENGVARNNDKP